MRLAIQDSWPNLPGNAEREFIERFKIACANIDVECASVVTSDDIIAYDPSAVLVSHEFSRKLTGVPTIGLIWSPLSFFQNDPYRVKSLLSYDGYLPANAEIRIYLKDLQAGLSAAKPVSADIFLPTTYQNGTYALEQTEVPSLCYIGVHWDGARHRDLFETLSRKKLITCYGPEQSWKHLPQAYGGYLPFDGRSVIDTIGRHGMALCLHKAEHRKENTPSMRLFEAMSVGAIPICDDIEFARKNLSDFATFVDMTQDAGRVAEQIEAAIDEARRHPSEMQARARRAKAWFDENWSLEKKIKDTILPFVEEVGAVGRFKQARNQAPAVGGRVGWGRRLSPRPVTREPECEVVMRSGGRELHYLERAIGSVQAANSAAFRLGVILVDYKGRSDIEALCARRATGDFPIRYTRSKDTGFRSTALWDGLKLVKAPFVAHLDDDDTVFENHYRHLSSAFLAYPSFDVCYSGVIRVEDEEGYYVSAPNFDGPLNQVIAERREVKFLDAFNLERLAQFDNFIQSNAWMSRTDFLQSVIGEDPELFVVEDVYLYLLMAARGAFGFTGSPTALWHWRSKSNDNSMMSVDQALWAKCVERVKLRLGGIPFRATTTFDRLFNPATSVDYAAPKHRSEPLAELNFDKAIEGGLAFKNCTILTGFHEPEAGGIWSKTLEATVLIPLGYRVRDEGGVLLVECLGSMKDTVDRWIELSVLEGANQRVDIVDWSLNTVELPLPAGTASPIVLKLTTSHLISPGGDSKEQRVMGGFIQSIRVVAADDERVAPVRVAALGLPGPWSVPVSGGVARGALETRKRVALHARASGPGRLYLGNGASTLRYATTSDGRFFIPGRLAEASRWFVFRSLDPDLDGEVHLEFTDEVEDAKWLTLSADAGASLKDYRMLDEGRYQHVAASLRGGTGLFENGSKPLYLLLQNDRGVGWWEVRPYYGPAWDLLFDLGQEASDEHGRYRRGLLRSLADIIVSHAESGHPTANAREFVAAAIMRSVLVAAIGAMATARFEGPAEFLGWLIDELLPS